MTIMSCRGLHQISSLLLSLYYVMMVVACSTPFLLDKVAAQTDRAIFQAVKEDDPAAIKRALEAGVDINTIGPGGQTPLVNAVLSGKFHAVQMLISQGADTSIPEKDGYNIMHAAAFQGRYDILKFFLSQGYGPLMTQHSDGFYPFHRSCWGREERHTQTVNVFIKHGNVDPNLLSADGKTCLQMTRNEKTKELIENFRSESEDEL